MLSRDRIGWTLVLVSAGLGGILLRTDEDDWKR
jgi:hypothetical protein